MIKAEIRFLHNHFSLVVKDHAGPQVCAGVSAITCGLVSFCLSHRDIVRDLEYSLEKGDSYVRFNSDEEFVKGAVSMAEIALFGIQAGHPDELEVICDREASDRS